MEDPGPIASLFSPANRRWTLTIIVAVAVLTAFLLLYDRGGSREAGTTATDPAATTGLDAASGTTLGSDEGVSDAQGTIGDIPLSLTSGQCIQFAEALSRAVTGGLGATGEFDVSQIDDAFARMSAIAPSEIADDLATMATGFREFYSTLEQAGVDLTDPAALTAPAAMAAFEQANSALESSGFVQASENVSNWLDAACAD